MSPTRLLGWKLHRVVSFAVILPIISLDFANSDGNYRRLGDEASVCHGFFRARLAHVGEAVLSHCQGLMFQFEHDVRQRDSLVFVLIHTRIPVLQGLRK